jgi:hypothetical protein
VPPPGFAQCITKPSADFVYLIQLEPGRLRLRSIDPPSGKSNNRGFRNLFDFSHCLLPRSGQIDEHRSDEQRTKVSDCARNESIRRFTPRA